MTVRDEVVPTRVELSSSQRALLEERLQRARQTTTARLAEVRPPTIPRRRGQGEIPLSTAQERLWFLDQLEPGSPVYNVCQAVRMRGALEVTALEGALNAIIQRHEVLRTNFVTSDGRAVQVIAPQRTLRLSVADLSGRREGVSESEIERRLLDESRRPFDLAHDLLVRALLIRTSEAEHTLMVTMHHIISDGWSVGIFFRDLAAHYAAICSGQPAAAPELPIQYADYVMWEREQLAGPALEKPLEYWRKQLAGTLPALELPLDHPRPAVPTSRGAMETLQLSRALSESIKTLGQRQGATLFMTLMAAFQVLLHRCTGQSDIVLGSVVAGRRKVELESLIGFFVNTLVFRGDLAGDPTFLELLERTRQMALGALGHQDVPFERLVQELRPDRAASRNPLFQVMFVLQNAPMAPTDLPGLSLEPIEVSTATAKFDLTLALVEGPQGLRAAFEYNADIFERATMARLLGCFHTLLESIVANPAQPISQLSLLTAAERHEVLVRWNETATNYPRETTVHSLIERQVARAPDAIALVAGDQAMTYGELNRRANQLAHRLRKHGVGPDTLVAICLERSPEMIVALLAILKAGGAYVSLDPSYPAERLAFMLADSQAPVVLTTERLQRVVPAGARGASQRAEIIRLDTDWPAIANEEAANPTVVVAPNHLAYVSYTSGSTGKPKGVCIEHRAVNRLLLETDYLQLTATDAVAQIANCAFDASTFEVWGPLLNGGRIVILPSSVVLSPKEFSAAIAQQGVTAIFMTTALFNQLAQTEPDFFRPLRCVLFGGEACNPACVRDVLRTGFPPRLLHVYGPTESTTFATWHEVRDVPADAITVPIGRALANTTLYVLDAQRQPVPVGVPGELYIGGDGLARGYLNRPELTAEKFVTLPATLVGAPAECHLLNDTSNATPEGGRGKCHLIDDTGSVRVYRTGDRVRWHADGTLEFLGRLDRQVKIRGFRIEPEEIEAVLQRHPAVKESVVVVREAGGERQLVGYVAPRLSRAELRQHLQASVPDYMVPAHFVFLDALPLNANGKVDRGALPEPDTTARLAYCEPRDETERQLAAIWQSVLGVERAGVHDSFFDLGGHSLLAVRLAAQVEKTFGRKLPVATIFQHGTVEQLARVLRGSEPRQAASSLVEIQGHGTRTPLYLVHGVGGGMFWGYSNLARHLGTDQPLYAFKSRGLDGVPEWPTIEEMAAHYVADLRVHQPRGPYLLGGYCFGGVVAYEMARQLQQQGEPVALLGLMNCSPPNAGYEKTGDRRSLRWQLKFLRNLGYWMGCFLFKWTWRERTEFVRWKFRILRHKAMGPISQDSRDITTTDVDELVNLADYTDKQREVWQTHVRALMRYQPKPYDGHVTLFRTRGHMLLCSFDEHYGWGSLARRGVTMKIMPGGHGNILDEPHVRCVAHALQACLADVAKPTEARA